MYVFRSYGNNNESSILANSFFGKKLESNQLNSLPDEPLNGCKFSALTYPQLGDDMFQLKVWLMKSYLGISLAGEQKIFDYRLSPCNRRIFNRQFRASVENVRNLFQLL